MDEDALTFEAMPGETVHIPVRRVHTLVVGSGAAGLNAALQLYRQGVKDVCLLSEGLQEGTSINAGSDKQTYYKLGISGPEADAPVLLAKTLFSGGGMHGDIALVEAALSIRAFMNLVNLGVAFPHDAYGQYVGYKTDHDPLQRATSAGPYTSRDMCFALHEEIVKLGIPFLQDRLVVSLVTLREGGETRASGAVVLKTDEAVAASPDPGRRFEIHLADNVVFAVGGPGGLYEASVYPERHTGSIGLALLEGAEARNLTESQFGIASLHPRWNTSGSYMQVVPRVVSTAPDGGDAREFLLDTLPDPADLNTRVFLKGYQWPFDVRKMDGSSLVDLLVYLETVVKGRRVFLDFRRNPAGFALEALAPEARTYLVNSRATQATPIERLLALNPDAVALYRDKGVDLAKEPLEIAVCAQHNNGGLAAGIWWESPNIRHLFPVGEVNGSHGVARPGGAALNAGQVGGIRAAEFIAHRYRDFSLNERTAREAAVERFRELFRWLKTAGEATVSHVTGAKEFRARMTAAGGHIRSMDTVETARKEAWAQWRHLTREGYGFSSPAEWGAVFTVRHLCFAHAVYLDAIAFALKSGMGSRGSALVVASEGRPIHPRLGEALRYVPENPAFRERVLRILPDGNGGTNVMWVPRREIPPAEGWFETTWADFRAEKIFESR